MSLFLKKNIIQILLSLVVSGACGFFTLKVGAMISEQTKNNVTRREFSQYVEWRSQLDSEIVKRLEETDKSDKEEINNLRADIRDLRDELKTLNLELKQRPIGLPRY
jgi:hypothetical protein